ncbi:uncharacterized protein STEHIDRAFT_166010 [Stereum hirsutum FP-91666 SS1]|uniref:uncharacterized protein n=1 Tax=Stereum hirsutum (strain FP-91666) TaxID=721885 RepID=UPI000440ECD1|nr:uncharacterized protein STEHIDRAFT_166010 [Stereum hirsutum FP-91666 SS1]EIM89642.1 hypothetical protein STEHIDRAFT_166010 [Stereum hirsutum FP-91666 SS1]
MLTMYAGKYLSAPLSLFISSVLFSEGVASQSTVTVSVSSSLPTGHANVVQDNFLGISWELSSFDTLWGKTNSTIPNAMQNYLSNFRARISQPLRIRVGGNSMDSSTYDPDKTDTMLTITDSSYYNDEPVTFGPVFFEVLNEMADKVGEMQFLVGLSMQQAPEDGGDDNALLLANASEALLGSRLDAMLLGNEPDLYANHGKRVTYEISDYLPEIDYVVDNLTTGTYGDLRSSGSIGGPTICCNWELTDVIDAGLGSLDYKYYTLQHYPDNFCSGATDTNTNISAYLTHTTVPSYTSWNSDGVLAAAEANVPILMTEFNTCSCGGSPTISPTFTATLWAVDAALSFVSSNLTAVYLHTREAGVTYNLFDPPTSGDSTETGWYTYSTYYAALMLTEVASLNGSVIQDLNVENSKTNASSTIAAYAIWDFSVATDGLARSEIDSSKAGLSKFVFINYSNTTAKTFVIPSNLTETSTVATRSLVAPHVNEETDISWAGQTVGDNGDLTGDQTTEYLDCGNSGEDGCVITVPGPGIVLALLDPNASSTAGFYVGNSTIAGLEGYESSGALTSRVSQSGLLWSGVGVGLGLAGWFVEVL